jgi:hypothetical protein
VNTLTTDQQLLAMFMLGMLSAILVAVIGVCLLKERAIIERFGRIHFDLDGITRAFVRVVRVTLVMAAWLAPVALLARAVLWWTIPDALTLAAACVVSLWGVLQVARWVDRRASRIVAHVPFSERMS